MYNFFSTRIKLTLFSHIDDSVFQADFYIRVFVRVHEGKRGAALSSMSRMMVHQSTRCPSFHIQPMGTWLTTRLYLWNMHHIYSRTSLDFSAHHITSLLPIIMISLYHSGSEAICEGREDSIRASNFERPCRVRGNWGGHEDRRALLERTHTRSMGRR